MAGKKWTKKEEKILCKYFPHEKTEITAGRLGRGYGSTAQRALSMGLCKTEQYMAAMQAETTRNLTEGGKAHRFTKGHEPANKGVKQSEWLSKDGVEASSKTRFKKEQMPVNYKPIGSERITKDGYVEVKVKDPNKWDLKHRIEWEKVNGKIPAGMIVVLKDKDGDKTDCRPELWELITRAENMQRNSYHNYGPEIAKTFQALGVLTRQINKTKRNGKENN